MPDDERMPVPLVGACRQHGARHKLPGRRVDGMDRCFLKCDNRYNKVLTAVPEFGPWSAERAAKVKMTEFSAH